MIKIIENQLNKSLSCECGQKVKFTMHWDVLVCYCKCGKSYKVKTEGNIWNCCSGANNDDLYAPDGIRRKSEARQMLEYDEIGGEG